MKLETFFEKFDKFGDAPDAVAKMRELVLGFSANGAPDTSLGRCPRKTAPHSSQALKGRANGLRSVAMRFVGGAVWIAPSGLDSFFTPFPGRCPGLVWDAALRLKEPPHEAGNLL